MNAEEFYESGFEYLNNGCFDKARVQFQAAIRADPNFDLPYFMLGGLCVLEENYKQAVAVLEKFITLDPSVGQAYYLLGLSYLEEKQFVAAEENFKKGLERDPGNNDIYFRLGLSLGQQLKLTEAIDNFEKYFDEPVDLDEEKIKEIKDGIEILT
jgi:tetratricopeptide (TPR) repeat protein